MAGNLDNNLEKLLEKQINLMEAMLNKANGAAVGGGSFAMQHREKHGHPVGPLALSQEHRPLYEDAFFQDCTLNAAFMNLLIQPRNTIVNMIPVRPNNFLEQKFGFLTFMEVTDVGVEDAGTTACDPCLMVDGDEDFCTISFPYGRYCRRTKTLETNELIRRFCARQYDDFYFEGDVRGVPAFNPPFWNAQVDRQYISQSAVRRQLWRIGRSFQLWMMKTVWTGDPANNVGDQYKEFYGLLRLITDDYDTNDLPITAKDMRTRCSALNSDIKDFEGDCVGGGGKSLFEYLEELEFTLYTRAMNTGNLPVQWGIFMPSMHWNEITKHLPCEMATAGCGLPANAAGVDRSIALNQGNDLFLLSMREQMRNSMSITLNGRTYPVYLEDALPYTFDSAEMSYTGDIFFIPFRAGGREVLYWEHIDYSAIDQELAPIPGSQTDVLGWTDGGRYHHVISAERWCFEVQTKMEVRLVFLAPFLAGRIQNVCVRTLQEREVFYDGAFGQTGQLVKPTP
jgi:hypothetical protein